MKKHEGNNMWMRWRDTQTSTDYKMTIQFKVPSWTRMPTIMVSVTMELPGEHDNIWVGIFGRHFEDYWAFSHWCSNFYSTFFVPVEEIFDMDDWAWAAKTWDKVCEEAE